jgi:cytochrome c556
MKAIAVSVFVLASSTVALAAVADVIAQRISHFKQLGAAFKTVMDGSRSGDVQSDAFKQSIQQIDFASHKIKIWFPAGSGPEAGVKTAALPVIWSKPADFRTAQDNLAREAAALKQISAGGDAAAIRSQALKLGGTCKACHDTFRADEE